MKSKSDSGFTLIEIIIAVAILAILIGIAVPMILGHVNKTKKTVCDSNIQTLMDVYLLRLAEADGPEEAGISDVVADEFPQAEVTEGTATSCKCTGLCPAGGEYDISITKEKLTVNCSVHGAISTATGNEFIEAAFKTDVFEEYFFTKGKKSMDSEAPGTVDTPYAQKIKDALKAGGLVLDENSSWRIFKANDNEFNVFITDKNIAGMSVGDTVNAVKYVADRNGTVVAETSGKVSVKNGDNGSYRIINGESFKAD